MKIKIAISVVMGDERFMLESVNEIDPQKNDYQNVAIQQLNVLEHQMESAIAPCFWDHDIVEELKNAEGK